MRLSLAFSLLILLAAPFGAHGEDVPGAVRADGTCPVPAAADWTSQEKYVWDRVCRGDTADFNEGDAYGGNYDPRKDDLPETRVLRPSFLTTILLEPKYRSALTRRGVRIVGARFKEKVDLENAPLDHELWLDESELDQGGNFNGLTTNSLISLMGSKVADKLYMQRLHVDEDLMLNAANLSYVDLSGAHVKGSLSLAGSNVSRRLVMETLEVGQDVLMNEITVLSSVFLSGSHVGGQLSLHGASVKYALKMETLHIGDDLFMDDAKFNAVDLVGAHVEGSLFLNHSKVNVDLVMRTLQVGDDLVMNGNSEFMDIDLRGAHVGGQLYLTDSTVTGKLRTQPLQVARDLFMNRAEFVGVDLTGAQVGGQLDLSGSKVRGALEMRTLQVAQNLLMNRDLPTNKSAEFSEVSLQGAHVGGQLDLSRSIVRDVLDMTTIEVGRDLSMDEGNFETNVILSAAKIGGKMSFGRSHVRGNLICDRIEIGSSVVLNDAEFYGPVNIRFGRIAGLQTERANFRDNLDITRTQVAGGLDLWSSTYGSARWLKDSKFILRDAKADIIQASLDAWPDSLDLTGFVYRNLSGEFATAAGGSVQQLENWLGKQGDYSPQTYEQLALALQNSGESEKATAIRFAGKDRERQASKGLRKAWLTLLDWVVGYGYYPWRAIYWAFFFVALGGTVLYATKQKEEDGKTPIGFAYSFDILLPIVRLREKHYQIDLAGWPRYYFYFHKLMGYVLASFLIAGLSGLTK